MPVGSAGVSNFAYVTSGVAVGVVADDSEDSGVSIAYGSLVSGPLLTEAGDFLLTESSELIEVE
jgi:hypothetical protein